MWIAIDNKYLDVRVGILMLLALGAAIFFWGRGIRRVKKSDLIAGPVILLAMSILLIAVCGGSSVFSIIGGMIALFGIATLLLSIKAPQNGALRKRDIQAIGMGAIIAGFCLTTIL